MSSRRTTTTTSTMAEEPVQYVYYHEGGVPGQRPVLTGAAAKPTFTALPTIDLGALESGTGAARRALAGELDAALREVGFFYATGHGIDAGETAAVLAAARRYFALPAATKLAARSRRNRKFRGYEPLLALRLDPTTRGDLKEGFLMGEDALDAEQQAPPDVLAAHAAEAAALGSPRNQWPTDAAALFWRPAVYRYWSVMRPLAARLLRLMALALDLPEDHFEATTRFPITNLRALHYPPQEGEGDVGIGAHTDFTLFTLLLQGPTAEPALEVLNPNGAWVPAPPVPGAFVVNVGDFLQRLTGGRWRSTVHRVRNRGAEHRYAVPFFCSPDEDAVVRVIDRFRTPQDDGGGGEDACTAGEFFERRLQISRRTQEKPIGTGAAQVAQAGGY